MKANNEKEPLPTKK